MLNIAQPCDPLLKHMKCVILAGGRGMRLNDETQFRPKPLIEIGGKPIIAHLIDHYRKFGFWEFYILGGYKFQDISDWTGKVYEEIFSLQNKGAPVPYLTLVPLDTGIDTQTGGRIKQADRLDETFALTYADGLADIDLKALMAFHKSHGKLCTITAVHPPARFGALDIGPDNIVRSFKEKPDSDTRYINGGFFIVQREVQDMIEGDGTSWETDILPKLTEMGELVAYRHDGFFQCLDTAKDAAYLNALHASGDAPWI